MTATDQAVIRARVLAKPGPVQVVLRMLAVKASVHEPMETDEQIVRWMLVALEEWDEIMAAFPDGTVGEVEFAELFIERIRAEQKDGWGKILRGNAQ